jgi:hypothetical protein
MKRLLPSLLALFLSYVSFSHPILDRSPKWHEGFAVLNNGDTIRGQLQFTRKVSEGLLQVRKENKIEVLTVKDVTHFSFFDERTNSDRKFYTLSFQPESGKRPHEIFIEYIYGNRKVWIMNHKMLGFSKKVFQFNPFGKRTVVNQRYLLNHESGELLPMSKENALALMSGERREVLSFIQSNGLRLKTVDDFIALLDFQKSLF